MLNCAAYSLSATDQRSRALQRHGLPSYLAAHLIDHHQTTRKAGEWLRLKDFHSGEGFDDLDEIA